MDNSVVFVMTTMNPSTYTVEARHEITEQKLANVVGILPGKSKKDEYVIFSGHYDHIGYQENLLMVIQFIMEQMMMRLEQLQLSCWQNISKH